MHRAVVVRLWTGIETPPVLRQPTIMDIRSARDLRVRGYYDTRCDDYDTRYASMTPDMIYNNR